jgi:hypothetical protein
MAAARSVVHTPTMRRSRPAAGIAVLLLATLVIGACTERVNDPPPGIATPGVVVGDAAPSFDLRSSDRGPISSSDLIGRKPVLLYFSMGPG